MPWTVYGENDELRVLRSDFGFGSAAGATFFNSFLNELWINRSATNSPIRRLDPETLSTIGDVTASNCAGFRDYSLEGATAWFSEGTGFGRFFQMNLLTGAVTANIVANRGPVIEGGFLYEHNTPGALSTIRRRLNSTGEQVDPAVTVAVGRNLSGGSGKLVRPGVIVYSNPGIVSGQDGEFVRLNTGDMSFSVQFLEAIGNQTVLSLSSTACKPNTGVIWTGNQTALYGWDTNTGEVITITDFPRAGVQGPAPRLEYIPGSDAIAVIRDCGISGGSLVTVERRHPLTGALLSRLEISQPQFAYGIQSFRFAFDGRNSLYFQGQSSRIFRVDFPPARCAPVQLRDLVYDLCTRAGVPSDRIDTSQLSGEVIGAGIGRTASTRQIIEILQNYGFFDAVDRGRLIFRDRDRLPDTVIGGNDLASHVSGEQRPSAARRTRTEDYELPREVRVQYSDSDASYEPGVQIYERRLTDSPAVADIDLSMLAMDATTAARIAEVAMLEAIVAREAIDFTLSATGANKTLIPSDIKTLDVGGQHTVVRLIQEDYAWPGVQSWQARRHDPSIYASDAVGIATRLPRNPFLIVTDTVFELMDAPLVRLGDDVPGYFAALGGTTTSAVVQGWPGGELYRRDGAELELVASQGVPSAAFGSVLVDLGAADYTIRTEGPLQVQLQQGALTSATLEQMLDGANYAVVEVRSGSARIGWEVIQYQTAAFDSGNSVWTLTGLLRGRFGTEWAIGLHQAGDRFVAIPSSAQVPEELEQLGVSRDHLAATIGRELDDSAPVPFAWNGEDRVPYTPVHLRASRLTNDIRLSWSRRDRVGTELVSGQTLPLSEAEERYRVRIYDGSTVVRTLESDAPSTVYIESSQQADFSQLVNEVDIGVAQLGVLGWGREARALLQVVQESLIGFFVGDLYLFYLRSQHPDATRNFLQRADFSDASEGFVVDLVTGRGVGTEQCQIRVYSNDGELDGTLLRQGEAYALLRDPADDGFVYVVRRYQEVASQQGRLEKIDLSDLTVDSGVTLSNNPPNEFPTGAIFFEGELFITTTAGEVIVFNTALAEQRRLTSVSAIGLFYDPDESGPNVWVCDRATDAVHELDPTTGAVETTISLSAQSRFPLGAAVYGGHVYVACLGGGELGLPVGLFKYDADSGVFVESWTDVVYDNVRNVGNIVIRDGDKVALPFDPPNRVFNLATEQFESI